MAIACKSIPKQELLMKAKVQSTGGGGGGGGGEEELSFIV